MNLTLKNTVFISTFSLLFIISIILTGTGYFTFKNYNINSTEEHKKDIGSLLAISLEENINSYFTAMEALSIDFDSNGNISDIKQATTSLELLRKSTNVPLVSIGLKNGLTFENGAFIPNFNAKEMKREWYQRTFNGETKVITQAYNDAATNRTVFAFSSPLYKNNEIIAAVVITIELDTIKEFISKLTPENQVFVYDNSGYIVSARRDHLISKNIFSERPEYKSFINNELNYSIDNRYVSAYKTEVPSINWNVVSYEWDDVIAQPSKDMLIDSIILFVIVLSIALILVHFLLIRLIYAPIGGEPAYISSILSNIANGNLSEKFTITGKETGIYASAIALNQKLSSIIKNSLLLSDSVSSASEELTLVMNDTSNNSQQELTQVEAISTAINELSSTSKEVSINALHAENETQNAINNVTKGLEVLNSSISLAGNINDSVQQTADMISELKINSNNIGEVTTVISSISEQTNLLALNAAIEAARAGEQGRGFAVVADEVRNLAAKTQESTKNIQEIILKLQEQSEIANTNIASNVIAIQEYINLSEDVKTSFDNIVLSVQSISDVNTLVATASQEQLAVTENIAQNTTATFDLVHQNVSAINQTQQAAAELSQLAVSQKNELSFFLIDDK
ncbi:methyl-accepting chemotaxis protein [Aliivibrio fischeri]|uniref:methyl-accepting chemotaxis protein n=1 Tax=Aliivibrio fischeri TaxID=668 RepID=UPI00107ED4D6|nr:methyl-accepting chemotaxis protein [Aliivibrio fischeri]MCE7534989.1 methyl-accepting chemotaxis protein [Aliivibrio fischeri]MCE7557884.1 methyl-accepting chemotaxis protein [Aliivibrio fischeri]TGA72634.1 methyl-accepting chemotaxis protein [Aliivibrio fischeri]